MLKVTELLKWSMFRKSSIGPVLEVANNEVDEFIGKVEVKLIIEPNKLKSTHILVPI
jgi:hypothetical protein